MFLLYKRRHHYFLFYAAPSETCWPQKNMLILDGPTIIITVDLQIAVILAVERVSNSRGGNSRDQTKPLTLQSP